MKTIIAGSRSITDYAAVLDAIAACGWRDEISEASALLGIDWMNWRELCNAIPPIYTEWIGRHLMQAIGQMEAV